MLGQIGIGQFQLANVLLDAFVVHSKCHFQFPPRQANISVTADFGKTLGVFYKSAHNPEKAMGCLTLAAPELLDDDVVEQG